MDKQRIIEIAQEIARRNEEKLGCHNPKNVHVHKMPDVQVITLIDSGIAEFVAAILIEAAKVCDKITDEHREKHGQYGPQSGAACSFALEEMAEGLTE